VIVYFKHLETPATKHSQKNSIVLIFQNGDIMQCGDSATKEFYTNIHIHGYYVQEAVKWYNKF